MNLKIKKKIQNNCKLIIDMLKDIFTNENLKFVGIFTIIGLIIHGELMIREVYNPDTELMGYMYKSGMWDISLGRWFMTFLSRVRFGLSTPVFSTFFSIIILNIAILFLINLFKIKKTNNKILTAMLILTLPPFMGTFTYFYCSIDYTISMLCSVLVPWCIFSIKDKNFAVILSGIFFMISMAIYQSYIGVSLGLSLIYILVQLYKSDKDRYNIKIILKDILYIAIASIVGIILYSLCTKIITSILNISISDYSGANRISITKSIQLLPQSICKAYKEFFYILFTNKIVKNSFYHRDIINALAIFTILAIIVIKNLLAKKYKELLLQILVLSLLPVAFNAIVLIATERDMSLLMIVGMYLIFELLIILLDNFDYKLIKLLAIFILVILINSYIVTINASYVAMDLTKQKTMSIAQTILERLYLMEEYNKNSKICIVGSIPNTNLEKSDDVYSMTIGQESDWGYFWDEDYLTTKKGWTLLYNRYFGVDIQICTDEEYMSIISSREFEKMEKFPSKNSIEVIDDIIVIKLTNDPVILNWLQ